MKINLDVEEIGLVSGEEFDTIKLMELTEEQEETINPMIPHTSGIRMKLLKKDGEKYVMKKDAQHMFLRVFQAVSKVAKEELGKNNPNVLLVSDDRPSGNHLVEYCGKIMANDGYNIYFQETYDDRLKPEAEKSKYYSRMGTPHASCALSLLDEIDLTIVLTASHNSIIWNGVKIYIELAFPISGRVMQTISETAISLDEVELAKNFSPSYVNADKANNEYILNLLEKVIDISILNGKKIVLWPFMGVAPELNALIEQVGAEVVLIDEDVDPPNPTDEFDREKVETQLKEHDANIAILLDADRDRIVFIIQNPESEMADENGFVSLTPNELYTAMHNLLAKDFGKKFINVRTIPSDPRCDPASDLSLITGVGYKHLGMVLYSAIGEEIDEETFQTGIIYEKTSAGFKKLGTPQKIRNAIADSGLRGDDILMVLWEESGGNVFNILSIKDEEEQESGAKIESVFPPLGDKYPAMAILVLCTLIEKGYDLNKAIDQNIIGTRTKIKAEDKKKVKILETFSKKTGEDIKIENYQYKISTFEQIGGKTAVIHFGSGDTDIYFRPSGTGPVVRIYVYGPKDNAIEQMNKVKDHIETMFA